MYALAAMILSDNMHAGLVYFRDHSSLALEVVIFAFLGYVSITLILTLIALFGATEAELVKYIRRICTVVTSFLVFQKPMTKLHAVGFAAVVLSYTLNFRTKSKPSQSTSKLLARATIDDDNLVSE